jgi:hypothetical protein
MQDNTLESKRRVSEMMRESDSGSKRSRLVLLRRIELAAICHLDFTMTR